MAGGDIVLRTGENGAEVANVLVVLEVLRVLEGTGTD